MLMVRDNQGNLSDCFLRIKRTTNNSILTLPEKLTEQLKSLFVSLSLSLSSVHFFSSQMIIEIFSKEVTEIVSEKYLFLFIFETVPISYL